MLVFQTVPPSKLRILRLTSFDFVFKLIKCFVDNKHAVCYDIKSKFLGEKYASLNSKLLITIFGLYQQKLIKSFESESSRE